MRVPVLTYHSINVGGNDRATNDHVALAADLHVIGARGLRIVPLARVVDVLLGEAPADAVDGAIAISFDDGSWFDWHDMPHPTWGPQRGFAGILRDFAAATKNPVHATSFVIVSPQAREELDRTCLVGRGWWRDEWWPEAQREGLIAIENHSWDHNHHTLARTATGNKSKGSFNAIDNRVDADAEIRDAGRWLRTHVGAGSGTLLAYPYGESSPWLVEHYLPVHRAEHGLRAAFDTRPAPVESDSARWQLPRYVCGRDWTTLRELERLLDDAR